MPQFEQVEGSVIIRTRGRFTEAKIYQWNNHLFAKHGSSFIRLKRDGGTSLDRVWWNDLDGVNNYGFDAITQGLVLTPMQLTGSS